MRSPERLWVHALSTLALTVAACRCPPAAAPRSPFPAFAIASRVLGETRRINVYTPPGYGERPGVRYPVLYMPDGGMEEDFVHVAEAVQFGVTWGFLRPLIVVGIENTERRRDMTGPTQVDEDRKIAPRVGGSAAFRAFIRRELMPEVAARYRVTGQRAIIGESLAGLFVVETFFLEPDLFDTYIAISPSLWWNDQWLVRHASERLKVRPSLRATLYMTSADEEDIAAGTQALAGVFAVDAPPGLIWFYHPMPDQFHDTIYRASAPKALRTVFPPEAGEGGS